MKKLGTFLLFSALSVFALVVLFPACEGPQGPPGADGKNGTNGTDGTDGVDANSFCVNCHNMENKTTITAQFAMSSHGIGNYVSYAGGRKACAKCHSYQGNMETQLTGRDTTASDIAIPAAFQCDMCHDFHGTLDSVDFPNYALRNNKPVSLIETDHMTTIDLKGSGNACATCHQPRTPIAAYNSSDSVEVSSTHWGGHHGPQGTILAGVGAFEPAGALAYENSPHTDMIGCSDCHMAKNPDRTDVGGHTWVMEAADGYQNMVGCKTCHPTATTFDVDGKQTEINGLLEELHQLLYEHGLYTEAGIHDGGAPVIGKYSANQAGAIYNYILFEEDRSVGVHNYKYTKACLQNTIDMVMSW
jgi:hypothetical protein